MEMIRKNLSYFWKFMPHEVGKDASPTQITEMNDIHPQIEAIVEYLNVNYAELKDENVVYYYYKNKRTFLGLKILLNNPESVLLGTIRIYHRGCENIFYYTFETVIEIPNSNDSLKKVQSELGQILKSLGLRKLTHSSSKSPIIYQRFKNINLNSFRIFYENLDKFSRILCLKTR